MMANAILSDVKEIYKDKSCKYCNFIKSYVSWWCSNKEAIKANKSALPKFFNCSFWEPGKEFIKLICRK